jgi:hypothetical protein
MPLPHVMSRHHVGFLSALLLTVMILAACGASQSDQTGAGQQPTRSPDERLYVWAGASGAASQSLLAIHPGSSRVMTLPAGLVSQDHQRLYAATASGDHTRISVYDTRSGLAVRTFTTPGAYSTGGVGFADAVLSGDGTWLALRNQTHVTGKTSLALMNTVSGVAEQMALAGDFELDGVSPAGTMLYLIQRVGDAANHYYVRAYDVTKRTLVDGAIVDKTEIGEAQMNGAPLTRQIAADGSRAYTLYIDPARNVAFIHGLPLEDEANGPLFARCIDLPVGASGALLPYYTLALSADGTTLYAANAALGLVTSVTVAGDVFSINIIGKGKFGAGTVPAAAKTSGYALRSGSTLSRDQKTLFVAGEHGIWVVDTTTLHLRSSYLLDHAFISLATSTDGRTLYAVDATAGVVLVDLASGTIVSEFTSLVQHAQGIEWVSA